MRFKSIAAPQLARQMLHRAKPDGGYGTFCFREGDFGQVGRHRPSYDEIHPSADVLPPEID
jgi:hypothetical protein